MPVKHKGFTILEVLIASLILFSVIVTVATIFENTQLAQERNEKHFKISSAVPFLLDEIRDEIKQQKIQHSIAGEGSNFGVNFYWQAEPIEERRPIRYEINSDGEDSTTVEQLFVLWRVVLRINYNGYEREFSFRELSWFYSE